MSKGIDRTVIVAAAFAVTEREGLAGLTTRALAAELGVKAPALYWHVKDKGELLDEMSTELWRRISQIALDGPVGHWEDELAAFARAIRDVLNGVRDGARIFGGAYLTDPTVFAAHERVLTALMADGFDLRAAGLAARLLYDVTLGFCVETQAVAQDSAARYDPAERDRRLADFPLTAAAGREWFERPGAEFDDLLSAALVAAASLRTA